MIFTEKLIKKINSIAPSDQGIFKEPYGIPIHIKDYIVYSKYETGGYRGGNCWNDNSAEPYINKPPINNWEILDIILKETCPNITYLQYKEISKLINTNDYTNYEYYGNSTSYNVEYIILKDLDRLITTFNEK